MTASKKTGYLAAHLTDSVSRLAGGMFESVRCLARGTDGVNGWRTQTFSVSDDKTLDDLGVWNALDVTVLRRSSLGPYAMGHTLSRQLLAASPAAIHVHGIWGPASIAGYLSARKIGPGLPLVVSPRGMLDSWALARSRMKKAVAWRLWTRGLLMRAGCIHALGEGEAHAIRSVLPNKPVCVIPNGVDLQPSMGSAHFGREKSILFIGRIHPKKGLAELLGGWARADLARSDWQLKIVGWDDGGHLPGLKAQASALGLGNSVQFLGPAYGEAKTALLRQCSAFILPSHSEGLPMAVLEAWSYGVPVIMTDACNLPEGFTAGAALKCMPEVESIAGQLEKLTKFMDPAQRIDAGERGRALVERRFSWAWVAARTVEVYEWLRGGSQPDSVQLGHGTAGR